jgi:hypothetical protein
VGGRLRIFYNNALAILSLPLLASVGGIVEIDANPALATCEGALIETVGDCAP